MLAINKCMKKIDRYILIAYAIKYEGDYFKVYRAIKYKEDIYPVHNINALTILDDEYPEYFRKLKYPPFVLFYKGDINLLKTKSIGVVGSRKVCDYAKNATAYIVDKLKYEYTIVSGMAKGVDTIAHVTALSHKTIAVLGSGIDYIYPKTNMQLYQNLVDKHLVISEYPLMTIPYAYHFPFRNRLIAAISDRLYVMQSSLKSGTLTTVNEILELDKDVYALPYNIFDDNGKGTNKLIQDGANMITIDEF